MTSLTPSSCWYTASTHQKQPPARTARASVPAALGTTSTTGSGKFSGEIIGSTPPPVEQWVGGGCSGESLLHDHLRLDVIVRQAEVVVRTRLPEGERPGPAVLREREVEERGVDVVCPVRLSRRRFGRRVRGRVQVPVAVHPRDARSGFYLEHR